MMWRRLMMLFALMVALLLGSHSGFAAEPAPDTDADAVATSDTDTDAAASSTDTADSTDAETTVDNADADDDEPTTGSLDGEGFVPSVQISEDLSVSFPTDI